MSLAVHFAITADQVANLKAISKPQSRRHGFDEIEALYFTKHLEWVAESDKAWDAMHRALTDGELSPNGGSYPLNHVVLGGEDLPCPNYTLVLKTPEQVHDVAT